MRKKSFPGNSKELSHWTGKGLRQFYWKAAHLASKGFTRSSKELWFYITGQGEKERVHP